MFRVNFKGYINGRSAPFKDAAKSGTYQECCAFVMAHLAAMEYSRVDIEIKRKTES